MPRIAGLLAAIIVFIAVLLWPTPSLSDPAQRVAAVLLLMVVLWMTEALPLPVTALLGPALIVLMGVAPVATVFAPFADPIIFLFIGSFILAQAMFVHRLDRRLAFTALASSWVGSSALRLVVAYATVACVISMWMSNTATTAMLFPLGLAVVAELRRGREHDPAIARYAMAMMLVTAFAASIGGMATPVGTPPNLIGKAFLARAGIDISFTGWMLVAMPIVAATMVFVVVALLRPASRGIVLGVDATRAVREELIKLGPVSRGERNVIVAFVITVLLWVGPGLAQAALGNAHPVAQRLTALFPESIAALIGALLLFITPLWTPQGWKPTITWDDASQIDWGIVLLFGGGLTMGKLADSTGLSAAMGQAVALQFPDAGTLVLTIVFTGIAIVLSEAASNTAAANIIVPTAIAVATAAGVSPLEPGLGAALGASMGFMMPVSTPPNAIVFSSGHIPLRAMMRHGVLLDVFGFVVIVVCVMLLAPLVR